MKPVFKLSEKWPYLQVITFVFAVVISAISPALGFLLAGIVGVYGGVLIEVNLAEKKQQLKPQVDSMFSDSQRKFVEQ